MKTNEETPQGESALVTELQQRLDECLQKERALEEKNQMTDDEKFDLVKKDIHAEKVLINSCHESALCRSATDHARALARLVFLASLSDSVQDGDSKENTEAITVGNMFVHLLLDLHHAHTHAWDNLPDEYSSIRSKLDLEEAKEAYEYWVWVEEKRRKG